MIRKYLQKIYLTLIFILLYAPIVTLVVLSFNQSKTRAKWGGFTLKWYRELFQNEQIMSAFYTTLIIAFISAAVATLIGTAAAIAIQGMKQKWKTMYMGLTNIPMMNAEIVMGVSLMLLFIAFRMTLGFGTILIAHITFNIPYVILSVAPKLKQTNRYTYEAALDLGASPLKAFFKVVFPDIVPGVLSGFMMAFTMSLDDFVITHFTKGPGVDTLSTKIYTEVRKGIKPEIYELSTIMFVTVLVLLILVNYSPKEEEEVPVRKKVRRPSRVKKLLIQRVIPVAICIVFIGGGFHYAKESGVMGGEELIVYNWGEYIDPDVLTMFEEETGIHVNYEEYVNPEEMYTKYKAGSIGYDLICTSDYMVERLISEGEVNKIDFSSFSNYQNIDPSIIDAARIFDPDASYSMPYFYGTLGILYNTTMVTDDEVSSWNILWDEHYKDSIIMQNSVRDSFVPALRLLNYDINTENETELNNAVDLLIKQKPLVYAYYVDETSDEMAAGNAAMALVYSGEAATAMDLNDDLSYTVPKEGSNLWIDSWFIPKSCKNQENAEKFLDFLCREDVAMKNFDYVCYATPNLAVIDALDDETLSDTPIFPPQETLDNCTVYKQFDESTTSLYSYLWKKLKSE